MLASVWAVVAALTCKTFQVVRKDHCYFILMRSKISGCKKAGQIQKIWMQESIGRTLVGVWKCVEQSKSRVNKKKDKCDSEWGGANVGEESMGDITVWADELFYHRQNELRNFWRMKQNERRVKAPVTEWGLLWLSDVSYDWVKESEQAEFSIECNNDRWFVLSGVDWTSLGFVQLLSHKASASLCFSCYHPV